MFNAGDGLKLYEQAWLPDKEEKAAVVVVHGYAEHSGRYGRVAGYLNQAGYAVYAFDLRGHGRSEGRRAYAESFDEYLDDVGIFLGRVKSEEAKKPVFLLGHSLGGTIAALFAITRRPDIKG